MVVGLTAAKFKPLTLSVLGFALSYIANIWGNMILYDFCLLLAQLSDKIINVRNFESHMYSVTGVSLGKLPVVWGTLFCRRCNFKR
jgi:hypothetical protein